jgi:hypothetical protein
MVLVPGSWVEVVSLLITVIPRGGRTVEHYADFFIIFPTFLTTNTLAALAFFFTKALTTTLGTL